VRLSTPGVRSIRFSVSSDSSFSSFSSASSSAAAFRAAGFLPRPCPLSGASTISMSISPKIVMRWLIRSDETSSAGSELFSSS
jgi:hypothetical protein